MYKNSIEERFLDSVIFAVLLALIAGLTFLCIVGGVDWRKILYVYAIAAVFKFLVLDSIPNDD